MSGKIDQRIGLSKAIAAALLDERFRAALQARTSDGARPIIAARVGDSMRSIFARLDANGGAANVVCQWDEGLVVLSLVTGDDAPWSRHDHDEPDQAVGVSATLGMLLAVMAESGQRQMRLRAVKPLGHVEASRSSLTLGLQPV